MESLAVALNRTINALEQKYGLINTITDFTYTGYNGGYLSDVNEIFFKKGEDSIMGAKYINSSDPTNLPTQYREDLDIQDEKVISVKNGTYRDPVNIRFDESAELGGSLDRIFKHYKKFITSSEYIKNKMVKQDLNYTGSKMPREVLPYQSTGLPSNVEVVRIPVAPKGFFRNLNPQGYDLGRIWYRTKQWVVKKVVIDTVFAPAVAILKRLNKVGLEIPLDPIYNTKADLMDLFDPMFGVRKMEYAYA